jgi:hypothetical protein
LRLKIPLALTLYYKLPKKASVFSVKVKNSAFFHNFVTKGIPTLAGGDKGFN